MLTGDYIVPSSGKLKDYYYLNAKNYLNEYDILSLIQEGITKEQKEKGQRAMHGELLNPFFRLKQYLDARWDKMTDVKKRVFEKRRYKELLDNLKSPEVDKDTANYVKNILGDVPKISLGKDTENQFVELAKGVPIIGLSSEERKYASGIDFSNAEGKEIKKIIRQFIILHEYGHLYEYMKKYVETGKYEIVDTFDSDVDKVTDSESGANAYAFDNLYRKDRKKFIENSDLTKERIKNAKDELEHRNELGGYRKSSQYLAKMDEKSKTLKRNFNY